MDRLLKPERLNIDPNSTSASLQWNHWYRTFSNFIEINKLKENEHLLLLTNFISSNAYEYINECNTYKDAITILKNLYVKPVNEIFARYKLATRRQKPDETIDQYIEVLKLLSKDCQYKPVTAEINRDDCIRDAFISGLLNPSFRQRLLENSTISLKEACDQVRSLELAQLQCQQYYEPTTLNAVSNSQNPEPREEDNSDCSDTLAAANLQCYFCGYKKHPREKCPAKDTYCKNCGKRGHFAKVCKSRPRTNVYNQSKSKVVSTLTSCTLNDDLMCYSSSPAGLSKATVPIIINKYNTLALVDTGSSTTFIKEELARNLNLKINHTRGEQVSMASTSHRSFIIGRCKADLYVLGNTYEKFNMSVLPNLCADIIIGHDLMRQHSSVELSFGGSKSPLSICGLAIANVDPAILFEYLSPDFKPVSVKSRQHTESDLQFITLEIERLLKEEIIEPSRSPWRAQALVTETENHKRRMVIDYSRTINRFTFLDAYPLPRIDYIVNKVANYHVYSTIDLRSAYHQIPIREQDKPFTAFEACGQLYQFRRIPFGVTNGVAAFQRVIDKIIKIEGLKDIYAYLDDVTICGLNQEEHDKNLEQFMKVVKKYNLTVNKEKSLYSLRTINLLGFRISHKNIKPDPDRLKPLRNLPPPTDLSSLRRTLGMFSHYSKYIPKFSEKIKLFSDCKFPLSEIALKAFDNIKLEIEQSVLSSIDNEAYFTVETDASETAIAATLSQLGRPVAFFSRSLSTSERKHSSIEKEAQAIVEAIRKWRHYLMGRHFRLITDQRSVSFMFDRKISGKIKNEKIMRWRLDLSCYSYDITYRPGKDNVAADTFSRSCSALNSTEDKLKLFHNSLCHPGVTRMYHWVRKKNLSFSLEDIKRVTSACRICAELKPQFLKTHGRLIKATAPFERLNIDFKGPLPSNSRNRYLLTIIDEYSRFPFAFPCSDISSTTVISKLKELFMVFGLPAYIHSDQGTSFMSQELKNFLIKLNVATSRTTPYNPKCNGQTERYNGIIWKTIELTIKSRKLNITQWELVLQNALHSIRSLLCTSTNTTPHERMFSYERRSVNGDSIPSWLMTPGPILLKRLNRQSKYEPLVDEVTLLEANPEYAYVRLPDGRETTISTRYLAPTNELNKDTTSIEEPSLTKSTSAFPLNTNEKQSESSESHSNLEITQANIENRTEEPKLTTQTQTERPAQTEGTPDIRRGSRDRRAPIYFRDYITKVGRM